MQRGMNRVKKWTNGEKKWMKKRRENGLNRHFCYANLHCFRISDALGESIGCSRRVKSSAQAVNSASTVGASNAKLASMGKTLTR